MQGFNKERSQTGIVKQQQTTKSKARKKSNPTTGQGQGRQQTIKRQKDSPRCRNTEARQENTGDNDMCECNLHSPFNMRQLMRSDESRQRIMANESRVNSKACALTQVMIFSSLTALKLFNTVNAWVEPPPLTTAASLFSWQELHLFRCRMSLRPHQT